jgi:hypothetical protein
MMVLASGCWSDTKAVPPQPPSTHTAPSHPASEPEVMDAKFGWYDGDSVDAKFHETTKIPHVDGLSFGWRLQLPCEHADLSVEEVFTLPSGGEWPSDPSLKVSADGTRATMDSVVRCEGGWIDNTWAVAPGDPIGEWTIRVSPRGYPGHTFVVNFVLPPPDMTLPAPPTP